MKNRIAGWITITGLALLMVGCNQVSVNLNDNKNASQTGNKSEKSAQKKANKNALSQISRDEFDKQIEQYKQRAKEAGRKIGNGADDLWIWTRTRAALAYADDLRDSTIAVDVENNVVTLTGTVADAAQKTRAEEIAKGIGGVQSVKNQLRSTVEEKPAPKTKEKK